MDPEPSILFRDRPHAGRLLAARLQASRIRDPILVALPRGGVPIGYELARALGAPLEVLVVRKVGAPLQPEYGIGAVTEKGYYWIDEDAARRAGASRPELEEVLQRESTEVKRRVALYRGGHAFPSVKGKTAIVVDDGLATGVTARVACHYLKNEGAAPLILAAPVCARDTARFFRDEMPGKQNGELDEVICLAEPENFYAVGQFYEDFGQTSDDEVVSLLARARREAARSAA
jgi:putative phosphoribosyl transferase